MNSQSVSEPTVPATAVATISISMARSSTAAFELQPGMTTGSVWRGVRFRLELEGQISKAPALRRHLVGRARGDPQDIARRKLIGAPAGDRSAAPFAGRRLAIARDLAADPHRRVASLDHELVIEVLVHLDVTNCVTPGGQNGRAGPGRHRGRRDVALALCTQGAEPHRAGVVT